MQLYYKCDVSIASACVVDGASIATYVYLNKLICFAVRKHIFTQTSTNNIPSWSTNSNRKKIKFWLV